MHTFQTMEENTVLWVQFYIFLVFLENTTKTSHCFCSVIIYLTVTVRNSWKLENKEFLGGSSNFGIEKPGNKLEKHDGT